MLFLFANNIEGQNLDSLIAKPTLKAIYKPLLPRLPKEKKEKNCSHLIVKEKYESFSCPPHPPPTAPSYLKIQGR